MRPDLPNWQVLDASPHPQWEEPGARGVPLGPAPQPAGREEGYWNEVQCGEEH